MKNILLLALVTTTCVASAAHARKAVISQDGRTCKMVETATLGVNFNQVPVQLDGFQAYINQKRDEILGVAADLEIKDIVIQNMNYNIYPNNNSGYPMQGPKPYFMNGGMSFQIQDTENAPLLMEKVGTLGYQVNFNVSAYRQCQ